VWWPKIVFATVALECASGIVPKSYAAAVYHHGVMCYAFVSRVLCRSLRPPSVRSFTQQHSAFLAELDPQIIGDARVGFVDHRPRPRGKRVRGEPGAEPEMHGRLIA
jgi:hypothetical protein